MKISKIFTTVLLVCSFVFCTNIQAQTFVWSPEASSIASTSDYYLLDSNNKFLGQGGSAVTDPTQAKKYAAGTSVPSGYSVISAEQYNALCPQQFIREQLGNNAVKCAGWYNKADKSASVYAEHNTQHWLSKLATPNVNGLRLGVSISGLKADTQYNLELIVSASVSSSEITKHPDGEVYSAFTTNIVAWQGQNQTVFTDASFACINDYPSTGNCRGEANRTITFTSTSNGTINIGLNGNTQYVFAAIAGISEVVKAGKYYLYNVGTNSYLTVGGWENKQAILSYGTELELVQNSNQSFCIKTGESTYMYAADNGEYLGEFTDGGVDWPSRSDFSFVGAGNGCYSIRKVNTDSYLRLYNQSSGIVGFTEGAIDDNALWKLYRISDMSDASKENPVDVTYLIGAQIAESGDIHYTTTLSAGAYSLSANTISQGVPGVLYANVGGLEQKFVFQDAANSASIRELTFIVLDDNTEVNLGFRYSGDGNTASNFQLKYLGDVDNADISSQVVNSDFNGNNEGLPSTYGWQSLGNLEIGGTRKVFNYQDVRNNEHGVGQIYNGSENVSQTITGLPNGWYKIDVQGFYRDVSKGDVSKERCGTFIYANLCYRQIQQMTSETLTGATYSDNGYPKDLAESLVAFLAGYYNDNSLLARVTDNTLKIGFLRPENASVDGADWTVMNSVKLSYFGNLTELYEGADATQYIKNPSFESATSEGWTTSDGFTATDNKETTVMADADGRYVGQTSSLGTDGHYYIRQTVSGTNGGLVAGTYALTARVTAAEGSVVTVSVNNTKASYTIPADGKVITLGQIAIANCTPFEISFSSTSAFCVDNVHLEWNTETQSNADTKSSKVTVEDERKVITFYGTWSAASDASEMNSVISAEGKGVTVDMETAILDGSFNIAVDNANNVMVYVPEGANVTINGSSKNIVKGGVCSVFEFIDGQSLNITRAFKANRVLYNREMSEVSKYATVVLPIAMQNSDDYTLYSLDGMSADRSSFSIVKMEDGAAANVPFILKRSDNVDGIHIDLNSAEGIQVYATEAFPYAEAADGIKLVGSYVYDHVVGQMIDRDVAEGESTYAENYYYIYQNAFYQGFDYFWCDAFRAYIDASVIPVSVRQRLSYSLEENEVSTGVDDQLKVSENREEFYSVNGTRLAEPVKGLNIVRSADGGFRKIIVR